MAILSIQSQVSVGHAGNSAAVFPLQRLGFEVWPVPTALLSSHKGHPGWRGFVPDAAEIEAIIQGIEARGAFARCQAVLVGYLAARGQVEAAARAVGAVRRASPGALLCLDPVMGEHGRGLYVDVGIAGLIAERLVPMADIVTPNSFELEYLAGRGVGSLGSALEAADDLRTRGPKIVICTSCLKSGKGPGTVATLAVTAEGAWRVATPFLATTLSGMGDAFAALFLGHFLKGRPAAEALADAVSSVYGLLKRSLEADPDADELGLIAWQEEIANPSELFTAERLR